MNTAWWRLVLAIRVRVARWTLRILVRTHGRSDLVRLGSRECNWIVPTTLLSPAAICYCAGAGEDISFDLALADRYGAEVVTIDPTPRAVAYAESAIRGRSNIHVLPVGLWTEDGVRRFYAPRDPRHVSHSILNLQGTRTYFEALCLRVSSVMKTLGHTRITLLKLDIEGAQFSVLRDVLSEGVPIDVICVEFDQPSSLLESIQSIRMLRRAGYKVVSVDGLNLTFVREVS